MKLRLAAAAALALAASLVVSTAYASDATPPAKKHARKAKEEKPSVQDQIDALRMQMQTQIDGLKSDLADKDAQLKQAQQQAADAQAAAAKAQAAADEEKQALGENSTAVTTLQNTVSDMKQANAAVVSSITDETSAIKKAITSPDALYYKGVTISPSGSFVAGETVWRQGATGGDINTALTGVPLDHSQAAQLSEFFGSGRQSRVALKATGKLGSATLTAYYEADWLSAGTTSNNNQSNSYTLRQRQIWGDAKFTNGWDVSAGTGWSLMAETTSGLYRGTEILPSTIDAQYSAGFMWSRQYSFRVSKSIGKKLFIGASAENAEMLNPSGQGLPSNYLFGSTGTGGGLYNSGANYSFNYTPDFIVKAAIEPGWGHWEIIGVERNFRVRIYPATGSPYNNTAVGAGIGGGFRGPLFNKKVSIGMKGLWGQGVGRYGSSTIADVTLRPDATLSPLHGFSALSTLEANPTPRLNVYFNYGADYIGRDWTLNSSGAEVGYGTYTANMSGCATEPATVSNAGASGGAAITPSNCGGSNKDVQEFTAGYWYNFYNGPKGRFRQGITFESIQRNLWSGNGGTTNPGGGASGTDNMFFTSLRYYLP
ncbi:MAG TPA: hypothetical protein VHD85_09010 [Terracidiphilus sp.]|nr:hypothetical protein [Terracidiphilus sp.]